MTKPSLKQWVWCIDYSNSKGQAEAQIPPQFFQSRSEARKFNEECDAMGRGKILKVEITVKK